MSFVKDAIIAINKALTLSEKVGQVGQTLTQVSKELQNHNNRILVLETRLDTIFDIGQRKFPK
ncbi:MAG: hypothetical protein KAI40_07915 [Desulfobacterales bacterium]|nr:hypothetical protein [Desulfobacterales bacterium]